MFSYLRSLPEIPNLYSCKFVNILQNRLAQYEKYLKYKTKTHCPKVTPACKRIKCIVWHSIYLTKIIFRMRITHLKHDKHANRMDMKRISVDKLLPTTCLLPTIQLSSSATAGMRLKMVCTRSIAANDFQYLCIVKKSWKGVLGDNCKWCHTKMSSSTHWDFTKIPSL